MLFFEDVQAPFEGVPARGGDFQSCGPAADFRVPVCLVAGVVLVHDIDRGVRADLFRQEIDDFETAGQIKTELTEAIQQICADFDFDTIKWQAKELFDSNLEAFNQGTWQYKTIAIQEFYG